jgi:peptide/nickel transport system permease protein
MNRYHQKTTIWKFAWLLVTGKPLALVSILSFTGLMVCALGADIISTHNPLEHGEGGRLESPSMRHYFGTDGFGRDVFSRVIHGARSTLLIGAIATTTATLLGIFVGTISVYLGGYIDLFIQQFVDILLGFPFIVLAIIIVAAVGPSHTSIIIAITLSQAPQICRLSRSSALLVKEESYIDAARVNGTPDFRIIVKHILPNSIPPVAGQFAVYFGVAVAADTTLSFLGLGLTPPTPSWGSMIHEGLQQYFEVAPWTTIFPIIALIVTVLSTALIGDAVRERLKPGFLRYAYASNYPL